MNALERIDAEHPWPGLLPFTEDARAFFHGRESETDDLCRLIERETLTVLFGQSGLGKSSLLNAGVFPRLRRAGYLPVYLRLNLDVGAAPLIEQVWQTLKRECEKHEVTATASQSGDSLWKYLHRPDTVFLNPHGRPVTPVLAFDQFEELFTLGKQNPEQGAACQALLRQLGELIENRLPQTLEAELTQHPEQLDDFDLMRQNVKMVFTFREDYLAEFEGLKTLIRPIMQNRMRLTPMNGARAADAIQRAGAAHVSEAIAERIVRFVGSAGKSESTELAQLHVEPALLSLVCRELNEKRIEGGEAEISADLIVGGSAQLVIETFYQQGFAGLHARVKLFVEDRLLTKDGYRDSCALDNALGEQGVSDAALQALVDRRLLRREERGGQVRLELIHDVLALVAKTSRDDRREVDALAVYNKLLERQRRQKHWLLLGGILFMLAQAGVFFLVWYVFELKADLKQFRATVLAENAEKAFAAQRFNEGQIFAAHALVELDPVRAVQQRIALNTRRLESSVDHFQVLKEQQAKNSHVALSPDQTVISSVGVDNSLKLWELATGTEITSLRVSQMGIRGASFSPDGKTLATRSTDKSIKLWDIQSGKEIAHLQGHESTVTSLAFAPDSKLLASASADGTIKLWEAGGGRELRTLRGHEGSVASVAISPDGKLLAASGEDKSIRLWDVASGKEIRSLRAHQKAVSSVSFSPSGKTIASTSEDNTIKLWDVATGQELHSIAMQSACVAFSPDGKTLASGSADRSVRLWDVESGKELRILGWHAGNISAVAFLADGKRLLVSADGQIRLWQLATGNNMRSFNGHEAAIKSIAFSPDGKTLASGSTDKTVRLWDFATGKQVQLLRVSGSAVSSIDFSPNGKLLAYAGDPPVKLWDIASGKEISRLLGHSDLIRSVSFSTDGLTLASASSDKTAKLWDVATGKELLNLPGHKKVNSVAFSPDRKTLAAAGDDTAVRLWDVSSGKELRTIQSSFMTRSAVMSVAYSRDGKVLVSRDENGISQWVAENGDALKTLRIAASAKKDVAISTAFSPDGKMAAVLTGPILQLWDIARGEALGSPIAAEGVVAFSPDGKWVATGYRGNTLRLWPVESLISSANDATAIAAEVRYGQKLQGTKIIND